jgi:hypothetical protein
MSGIIPIGTSLVEAALQGLIGPVAILQRNIGGFVADVTVREDHEDELVITENPVEQGADFTDHAFKAPARLTIEVGYSNSSLQSGGDPDYVQSIYAQFLALQSSLQPFDVVTGKRSYSNMMITLLHTVTDEATENALFLTVKLREIIIVQTQTVSVPPSSNMANPEDTGATQNQGTQQLSFAGGTGTATVGGTATKTPFNFSNAPFSAGYNNILNGN